MRESKRSLITKAMPGAVTRDIFTVFLPCRPISYVFLDQHTGTTDRDSLFGLLLRHTLFS